MTHSFIRSISKYGQETRDSIRVSCILLGGKVNFQEMPLQLVKPISKIKFRNLKGRVTNRENSKKRVIK